MRFRKLHSIATNPNYFSPPFAGVAFTPAAHHFVYALMANHSAERPEGILTPSDLMDFFSYTRGADGALVYTPGHEKIPEDWYKRAVTDPWTLADIVVAVTQQVSLLSSSLLRTVTDSIVLSVPPSLRLARSVETLELSTLSPVSPLETSLEDSSTRLPTPTRTSSDV